MNEEPEGHTAIKSSGNAGVLVFSTLVLCAAFGEVATGLIVPAMPAFGALYEKTPGTVQLTIGAFAVMFAVGQLFFGPFSDRKGRRTALLIGAALTLIGSLIAATADGFWMIVIGRAVQGLGAASGYVVSRAIVRDIYGAEGAAKAMAVLFALMAGSFLAAPLVGGVLLDFASWRAGFVFASAAALTWLASALFIVRETGTAAPASEAQLIRKIYLGLFCHRGFLAFMLCHSVAYAGLYCFVAGAPYFFIENLGLKPSTYGVIAAVVAFGFLVGSTAARYAIPRWGMKGVIPASLLIMLMGGSNACGAWSYWEAALTGDCHPRFYLLVRRRVSGAEYRRWRHDVSSKECRCCGCRPGVCTDVLGGSLSGSAGAGLRWDDISHGWHAAYSELCSLAALEPNEAVYCFRWVAVQGMGNGHFL